MDNLRDLTLEELIERRRALDIEIDRRHTLTNATHQIAELNRALLDSQGITPGDPWRPPSGGHDAYPQDWRVEHEGKVWESLTPANVWEPGVSGWREVQPETPDAAPPEWVRPTGGHDAYQTGDRVTFDGQVWESDIDGNVWSPTDYPAGWRRAEEDRVN